MPDGSHSALLAGATGRQIGPMQERSPTSARRLVVCVPVGEDGRVGHSWGRAARVAVGEVADGRVLHWEEIAVGWDALHDAAGEGSHHARIASFLREHNVRAVAAGHMGEPMRHMLAKMGIELRMGASGDARAVALALAEASS